MKYLLDIKNQKGFTLIEVIITIVMAGILGSILVSYVGTAVTKSGQPVGWLQDTLSQNMVMENIINDYNNTLDIGALSASVGAEGGDPNNGYGSYHVEENRYIEFDGTTRNEIDDTACPFGILKVTISNNTGKFTSLFTGNVPCP